MIGNHGYPTRTVFQYSRAAPHLSVPISPTVYSTYLLRRIWPVLAFIFKSRQYIPIVSNWPEGWFASDARKQNCHHEFSLTSALYSISNGRQEVCLVF
jgi:hypothetical protein